MFIVGLTGGIASGKTTVAQLFAQHGVEIIDTDLIARELVAPQTAGLQEISAHFGPAILKPEGHLNRSALRQLIFSNPAEKTWLENYLHPKIRLIAIERAQKARSSYAIIVIPLLLESEKADYPLDAILVVDTPPSVQLARLMQRDHLTQERAQKIIDAQAQRETRLKAATHLINNTANPDDLREPVRKLHELFLARAISS